VDVIFLHEYRLELMIGVYEWERKMPQTIQLDLEIGLPSSRASETDKIEDTIDYGRVVEAIEASVKTRHFDLLEAFAEHVAQLIRTDFKSPWVRISVTKLGMMQRIKRVGITIERGNKS
jgi:dihydroneopterin aldolase